MISGKIKYSECQITNNEYIEWTYNFELHYNWFEPDLS